MSRRLSPPDFCESRFFSLQSFTGVAMIGGRFSTPRRATPVSGFTSLTSLLMRFGREPRFSSPFDGRSPIGGRAWTSRSSHRRSARGPPDYLSVRLGERIVPLKDLR